MNTTIPTDPEAELLAAGVTHAQMATITGAGLRRGDVLDMLTGHGSGGCKPEDTILNKYATGALSIYGVMAVLYGTDSRQHHQGHA
jgi:hypothetical protein